MNIEEKITSRKNPIVLQTIKLKKDGKDVLFLENFKLIKEAKTIGRKFVYLLISSKKEGYFRKVFPEIFLEKYYLVSEDVLNKVCDTPSPQGYCCNC